MNSRCFIRRPSPGATSAKLRTARARNSDDLLIEDDLESESILGRGLDGRLATPKSESPASGGFRSTGVTSRAPPTNQRISSGKGMMLSSGGLMDDKFTQRNRPTSSRRQQAAAAPKALVSQGTAAPAAPVAPAPLPSFLQTAPPPQPPPPPQPQPQLLEAKPDQKAKAKEPEDDAALEASFNELLALRKARMADTLSRGKANWAEFDELRSRPSTLGQKPPPPPPPPSSLASNTTAASGDSQLFDAQSGALPEPLSARRSSRDRVPPFVPRKAKGLNLPTAVAMKQLIFGSANLSFNDEWRLQGFCFAEQPVELRFGLVQRKGGPCGVLSVVQAEVLRAMLFGKLALNENATSCAACLRATPQRRSAALANALAVVLWRCGERRSAVLALPSMRNQFQTTPKCRADGITETLELYDFDNVEELEGFILRNISQFEMESASGVVLLLYSAILTRGVQKCVEDMDHPEMKLMAAHGYCSQEMVNLLLIGACASNVFNDVVELDSMLLKGVASRADIGLLSLQEHFRSCEVGSYLKTPRFPIWIICSESHFSVLFALRSDLVSDWKAERRFDLFYYDGLARQDEEIKLSIDNSRAEPLELDEEDDDLVPPLERCIRTKWPDALIDWNGTDPLL